MILTTLIPSSFSIYSTPMALPNTSTRLLTVLATPSTSSLHVSQTLWPNPRPSLTVISQTTPQCFVLSSYASQSLQSRLTFRKIKAIDLANFKNDIAESNLCQDPPVELKDLVSSYNTTCASILNKHAPELTKTIIERPRVPWFNEQIRSAKRDRSTKERIWRTSKLDSNRASFLKARNNVSHLIEKARTAHYEDFVSENSDNQRSLFKAANVLLGAPKLELLPPHSSAAQLANDLGESSSERSQTFELISTH